MLDTGSGMRPENLVRNRQAWQSGADGTGHGLGLVICHQLAAQNGLDLTGVSHSGRGTVFSLRMLRATDT
ncbi:ATP-binding protein [Antarctobacter sp.]|uniref:ATP-binding protein n=1 Tax=Antarctobacter sp. TaxID=1872577 RepID=UPI003A5BE273